MNAKFVTAALAALLYLPAAGAQAQTGSAPPPAAAPPSRVGVLNFRLAILNTAEGKLASAELQSQFAPRNSDLENLRKQIEDAQNRLRAGANTMPDEEKARLQRQGEQWGRAFQRKQDELREDVTSAENEVGDRIGRKMMEIVDRYSRENAYAVVFDISGQTTPVLYASNQVDITQDIIRLFDQAHPVHPAGQPAPVRPATQQGPRPPGPSRPPQTPPKPPEQ